MDNDPAFVLITGLSGAGKSRALRFFEDRNFYCVDNLPASLLATFADLISRAPAAHTRIAVCVDARSGSDLPDLPAMLDSLSVQGPRPRVLFLDASDAALVRRYSETRRRHPASGNGSVEEGIRMERDLLGPIRERAEFFVDTTNLSASELRERIAGMMSLTSEAPGIRVSVMSFGFKHGVPQEADLVLDVRFLPNPHHDSELQELPGTEPQVREYVLNNPTAEEFFSHAKGLIKFLMPRYESEPKSYLTIAVGCTGGRHRSVAIAQEIQRLLKDLGYDVRLRHRDLERDSTL